MNPRHIGLTGGIGSGKSTVAAMLARRGAWVVDTDAISRALTAPGGAALGPIVKAFGPGLVNAQGELDRAALRRVVFSDPAARQTLEAILHPLIGCETDAQAGHAGPNQTVVFDVPLLAESKHWRQRVARVLVIDCAESVQIQRVMARSAWSAAEVQRVMAQQASREARRAIADAVILNQDLSLEELDHQVESVWQAWRLGNGLAAAV